MSARSRAVLLLLALASVAAPSGTACAESGLVVAVLDGDTIKVSLESGPRKVRLLGIDTPEPAHDGRAAEPSADRATELTRKLVEGRTVELEADPRADDVDQYDRALRYVFLPDGRLLNAVLVEAGLAQVYTRSACSRLEELGKLERAARDAGRGIWSPEAIVRIAPAAVESAIGSVATVCGLVASARYSESSAGRPTFLNLERAHPDQPIAIVIWGTVRGAFDEPEKRYANRRICATGRIREYRGKPEIVVSDPSQLEQDGTASRTGVSVPG